MKVTVRLDETGDEIVAICPELDINCYGSSRDHAVTRMRAVIQFYLESSEDAGIAIEDKEFEMTVID